MAATPRLKETPTIETVQVTDDATPLPAVAVTNCTMPVDLVPHQEAFELAGFTFGPIVGTEYSDVKIPDGWTRKSVGEYNVDLFDEIGRMRAEVRRKFATLLTRFRVVEANDQPGFVTWMVTDGDTVLYRCSCGVDDYAGQDQQFENASKWLRVRYSRAEDPAAYW